MDKSLILVVDDRPLNVETVSMLLSLEGYEVMPAYSGAEALQRASERSPSLVLLDMRMPEMDGFEVCARLREDPRTEDVPVIFLTAANEETSLVEAFRKGAVDYVTKPFVAEELLARVRTHLDLKRARDHLAALAQERADLTQIVAHDLKNPLSSIVFALDMAERKPERTPEILTDIRESAQQCLKFIDSYLGRWARSSTPRQLELETLTLAGIIAQSVDKLRLAAEQKRMNIAVTVIDDPEVTANAVAVRHVLDNLISNALRYAPANSAVDVRCETGRSGMARVTISDRGPGVPADKREQLFKRYVRMGGSDNVVHASGLGLAISKEEIERMAGHLWYEDRDGGGASFSFTLPRAYQLQNTSTAPLHARA